MRFNFSWPLLSYRKPSRSGGKSLLTGASFATSCLLESFNNGEWTFTIKMLGFGFRLRPKRSEKAAKNANPTNS